MATQDDEVQPGPVFAAMTVFFDREEWAYAPINGQLALQMPFEGHNARWLCVAQAREPQQQFVFYSVYPVRVPEERRNALAEFFTRANYGLIVGNFELDYNDGEMRYKTSVDVEGSELSLALIRQCVYANVVTMDQYVPGIVAILSEGHSPQEALALVEGPG
jgi:hypothetical protein